MTGVFPASGVGAFISGSTSAGGQITPSARASRSLKFSFDCALSWAADPAAASGNLGSGEGEHGTEVVGAAGRGICAEDIEAARANVPARTRTLLPWKARDFSLFVFMQINGRSSDMFHKRFTPEPRMRRRR